MRLLIVEDESRLAATLAKGLEKKGYAVDILGDGAEALRRISLHHKDYDLVILDLMLPGLDGLSVCQGMRERTITTPILVLTARAETEKKIELLLSGADDYLVKPFSFDELEARVQALLRRPTPTVPLKLTSGSIEMDTVERSVAVGGKPVLLTLKEFGLLEYFMRRPNEVINREDLLAHLWDFNYESFSNVIDVHVKNLRRKLANGGAHTIETVRGIGYRFRT